LQSPSSKDKEAYVSHTMPARVKVVATENEGPVFASADGKTLYIWPLSGLRNGQAVIAPRAAKPPVTARFTGNHRVHEPYPGGLSAARA